ncbi:hypothetical protein CDV36_012205 [Fusarium kuroshium]|uniref:Uncharacterized protein n=2 Tax=Fusarium solani species complex TaxID=232080 RepID=A0A3M2RSC8_9HYPO|nr:hypothetical protein CDV36_012205 [Fusarium kuroshium]
MTHGSDSHRGNSRREHRSRGREQTSQYYQGQPQPSASQAQYQQLPHQQMLQQQHQYTNSHASSSGYAATAGYAAPQGQDGTSGYDAYGYSQPPSTPRAHQGSAQDSQYSPNRDNTRVRIRGHRDEAEDPVLRTESFVREGNENRVASSRSSQSGRAIKKKKKDRAKTAIDKFNAAYRPANPPTSQYNEDPDDPDCGDGPYYGGSSYGDD